MIKVYLQKEKKCNINSFVSGTFRNRASLLIHVILVIGRIKLPELPSLHFRGIGVDQFDSQLDFEGIATTL